MGVFDAKAVKRPFLLKSGLKCMSRTPNVSRKRRKLKLENSRNVKGKIVTWNSRQLRI